MYSCIRVLPDEFLLKSVVCELISKEIRRAEHEDEHEDMSVIWLRVKTFAQTNNLKTLTALTTSKWRITKTQMNTKRLLEKTFMVLFIQNDFSSLFHDAK
jgi:hypothetical protein